MDCPRCERELAVSFCTGGRMLRCPGCGGTAVTVEMLRRFAAKERIDQLWRAALDTHDGSGLRCGGCQGPLRAVRVGLNGASLRLDVCTHCHLVWFDSDELHAFSPERDEPAEDDPGVAALRPAGSAATPVARDEIWRLVTGLQGLLS